jgi:hypothetical protein
MWSLWSFSQSGPGTLQFMNKNWMKQISNFRTDDSATYLSWAERTSHYLRVMPEMDGHNAARSRSVGILAMTNCVVFDQAPGIIDRTEHSVAPDPNSLQLLRIGQLLTSMWTAFACELLNAFENSEGRALRQRFGLLPSRSHKDNRVFIHRSAASWK